MTIAEYLSIPRNTQGHRTNGRESRTYPAWLWPVEIYGRVTHGWLRPLYPSFLRPGGESAS